MAQRTPAVNDNHLRTTTCSVGIRRRRSGNVAVAAVAVLATLVVAGGEQPLVAAAEPTTSNLSGTSAHHAAASCWEIKQVHPSSADGVYWLRNDSLVRPDQFHCDMTTDGGGWVLVGRGREGWTFRDYGQSTPQNIRSNVSGPAAFSPAALSTETVDALLDGGDVAALVDGVRVRRAANTAGTAWQELRWNFLDLTSWSWAVGGGHRLSGFSINGAVGSGSNTKDSKISMPGEVGAGNRSATNASAWFTYAWASHGGLAGFSYSGTVDGIKNATSHLWVNGSERHAIPFTQVYIRPRITTVPGGSISDAGLPAQTLAAGLDDRPAEIAGGVWGVLKVGDSEPALDTPVLAITTHADRVYVGGKFSDVRNTITGALEPHSYLAAFDRSTGAWIPSFDPQLDGTVWDLEVADGKLLVAGQFTNVNGAELTAGLAALDLTTGAVVPGWRASLTLSGSSSRPYARAIDVVGDDVYLGGNFTGITGTGGASWSRGRVASVDLADGTSNNTFLPDINNGTLYDIDVDNGRAYLVGSWVGVNGNGRRGVAVVDATTGALVPGIAEPVWTPSNPARQYQQAVAVVGGEVWQGGSEHNTQAYGVEGYTYLKGYVTSDRGGDTQAFSVNNGTVVQASHGNAWIYEDATTWPGLVGYSRVDDYKWIGAFDTATRAYDTSFVPSLDSAFNEGAWALHTDIDGCTWFGGDFIGGPYVGGQRQYLEGFSKFCQRDNVAPSTPANPRVSLVAAGGMQVNWTASNDNAPGFLGYEILRNDRVISPLVYGTSWIDPAGVIGDRYFVRSVDPAGNRSATSAVLVPGDNSPPSTPTGLVGTVLGDGSIQLAWTASIDNVGVASYRILRNGVEVSVAPGDAVTANVGGLGAGAHWMQIRAVDPSGNASFKTPSIRVDIGGPDVQRPSVPGSPTATFDAATGLITFSWTASIDDTGVTSYGVLRNSAVVASVGGATTSTELDLGVGGHYLQVRALDAAGNQSSKTVPVFIDVVLAIGPDTQRPSTPQNLTVAVSAGGSLAVSWTASTDNVGVTSYRVLRNLTEVAVVAGDQTTAAIAGLSAGNHYVQVVALDAAGNESFRTAPVLVTI